MVGLSSPEALQAGPAGRHLVLGRWEEEGAEAGPLWRGKAEALQAGPAGRHLVLGRWEEEGAEAGPLRR